MKPGSPTATMRPISLPVSVADQSHTADVDVSQMAVSAPHEMLSSGEQQADAGVAQSLPAPSSPISLLSIPSPVVPVNSVRDALNTSAAEEPQLSERERATAAVFTQMDALHKY